ncbi:MAG: hypothetical protein OXI96_06165 [Acidimicrobiaceae bacterium]|nr:hypothetical protein [Acidimicrobiaceae bacterium]
MTYKRYKGWIGNKLGLGFRFGLVVAVAASGAVVGADMAARVGVSQQLLGVVGVDRPSQLLAGSEVGLQVGSGGVVEFSGRADGESLGVGRNFAHRGDGLAPVWPFRGVVDSGRADDGGFVLRFWSIESGGVYDVPLGAMSQSEPYWYSDREYSDDHSYAGDVLYASEEFVITQLSNRLSPLNEDWTPHREERTRWWWIVVPWGDEAYPVLWPEVLVESELSPERLSQAEGFEVSFVEDLHRGSVLRVVTPPEEAYYDLDYSWDVSSHTAGTDEYYAAYHRSFHVLLELSEPPSDPVDYSDYESEDSPFGALAYDRYITWLREAPYVRFDGTDGYYYGITIMVAPDLEDATARDSWGFVFAGDTGEVVSCRRVFSTAGALLVKPEGWSDLVDRFVLPEAFSGSDCVGTGELHNLSSGEVS